MSPFTYWFLNWVPACLLQALLTALSLSVSMSVFSVEGSGPGNESSGSKSAEDLCT